MHKLTNLKGQGAEGGGGGGRWWRVVVSSMGGGAEVEGGWPWMGGRGWGLLVMGGRTGVVVNNCASIWRSE